MPEFNGTAATAALATVLREIPAPIFAAAWDRGAAQSTLFVHIAAAPHRGALHRQIAAGLGRLGIARVRVRFHNAAQLHAPRKLGASRRPLRRR